MRDILIGRMFGLGAVVRAGLAASGADAATVAEEVAGLAAKKSFLRETAAAVLLELAEALPPPAAAAMLSGAPAVAAWLEAAPDAATPEALLLALRLWAVLPPALLTKCRLLPKGAPPPPAGFFTVGFLASLPQFMCSVLVASSCLIRERWQGRK